jgi:hypothetical protein
LVKGAEQMKNKKNEQGIDLIARSLARNLRLNSRAAKAEARRIRSLWSDALLRGEPVDVPGLELQIVWGQQKKQLQPVPTGLLKGNRKTPIRLVKSGNSVKVSCRSTVYFEFDDQGNVVQVAKPLDRSRRVIWMPGVSMPEQKPLQKDKLVPKSAPPPTAPHGTAHALAPRPMPQVVRAESLRPHQQQISGSRTAMFRQNPGGRR